MVKKRLSYQLSWLQNWHVYSKELQGGLCRVCIIFDENKTGALRGNFVKNAFQNLAKSEKIAEHEGTEYHQRSCEKAESFLRTFENPTEAVNHDKKRESNYERNVHILKMIIEAVILFAKQGLALRVHRDHGKPASDDDDESMKKVYQGNFLAIVNTFAKFDTILKDHIEQGSRNAKMLSWNIQNDIISCSAEFVRDRIKEHISKSTYYAIIADEVTERYSNKEVLLTESPEDMKLSLILRILRDDLQVKLLEKPF